MRRRAVVLGAVILTAALAVGLVLRGREPDVPRTLTPAAGNTETTVDPLAWDPDKRTELERRAAAGLSHVLYAKSPGGAILSAVRTARWRPLVEHAARGADLDPDVLEGIVLLESAGREDARASNDLEGAAGLTQILAETGQNLLGMRIDVARSRRYTRRIRRAALRGRLFEVERLR